MSGKSTGLLVMLSLMVMAPSCNRAGTSAQGLSLDETRQLRPMVRQRALTVKEVDQLCETLSGSDTLAQLSAMAILTHPNAQAGYDAAQRAKVQKAFQDAARHQHAGVRQSATASLQRLQSGR
jgi:hypothetical protein